MIINLIYLFNNKCNDFTFKINNKTPGLSLCNVIFLPIN